MDSNEFRAHLERQCEGTGGAPDDELAMATNCASSRPLSPFLEQVNWAEQGPGYLEIPVQIP